MAKYSITCDNGTFSADFHGSSIDMLKLASCMVAGMYRHMLKNDKSGAIAGTFKEICENGILFDEDNFDTENEQYQEEEAKDDVQ